MNYGIKLPMYRPITNRLIFLLLVIVFISCDVLKEANVRISNVAKSHDSNGIYFERVTLKNYGEQPAYFVILIGKAYKNGNIIQQVDKSFGDIFPNDSTTYDLYYDKFKYTELDSVSYQISYSPSSAMIVR